MIISEKLLQFNKRSLFVVAGRKKVYFYLAFNGKIDKIDSIEMEEPTYSDNEGFFMRLGRGKFFGSGSVLEENKIEIERKFLKEIKEKTELLSRKEEIEEVYLFASGYIENGLPQSLPDNIKNMISFSFRGNYVKEHPFDLIKKIQKKSESKKTKFISESAMKILRKKKN
jgi:hypothetical protein